MEREHHTGAATLTPVMLVIMYRARIVNLEIVRLTPYELFPLQHYRSFEIFKAEKAD